MRPGGLLLWQVLVRASCHVVAAGLCLGGSDVFTSVRENSPNGHFISNISIGSSPGTSPVRLCLTGPDADWFYLDGRSIRLSSSGSKVLDREVQGPVLVAELTCYEDDVVQSHFRVLVEVLNENDNKPAFTEETVRPLRISELAPVGSVVFTVKAVDADGDLIRYVIDPSSTDARFFRIDLPNSGRVVLDKPLDYESRPRLQLVMWAQESDTTEKFNISAVLSVDVEDGDDQYPRFLPCRPASPGLPVCLSPTYTANITRTRQAGVLEFSPGPIRAEDGDRGLDSPLVYALLAGDYRGRFEIDNRTGEIRLTRPADLGPPATNFSFSVMVSQVDDGRKYSVAPVLVRVLRENAFPPAFSSTTFRGFIVQSSSPASIVSTYGNQVLQVQASDLDFADGVNPDVRYFLRPATRLYQVTREGVLIGRTDRLRAFDRHVLQVSSGSGVRQRDQRDQRERRSGLKASRPRRGARRRQTVTPASTPQVVARDEESGDEASASVDIEVLQRGQTVPRGAFTDEQLFGHVDARLAGVVAVLILLVFLPAVLLALLQTIRRRRPESPDQRPAEAAGKQPNVVNSGQPDFTDETAYRGRAFGHPSSAQSGSFHGRQGVYTRKQSLPPPPPHPPPSSSSNLPADSRSGPQLPPPSEVLLSEPAGLRRLQTDLFVVAEKPEGGGGSWETFGADDVTGLQSAGDDVTAGNTPQRDAAVKTEQYGKC